MAAALKLLVVEKDITHLEQMSQLLKQLKAEPCAISDSAEAVLMIHQEQFDGIFLDLNLPIVGGIHLARMVRESVSNQGTPIIIVTGPDQADAMHVSFSLGANYFLREPVDRQTLGSLLREIRKPSAKNRVRTSRVSLSGRVTCTLGTETLEGRAWNISQGGIVLEVTGLKLGYTVQISFVLPQTATIIRARGLVAWAQEERQGLYFTEMSVEHQNAVRKYILSG